MQENIEKDFENIQKHVTDLLQSPNPYALLKSEEQLTSQLSLLNALHPTDMGKLSSSIAFQCPAQELQSYIQLVSKFFKKSNLDSDTEEGLTSSSDTELGFCEMLYNALETKRIIQKLLDSNNPEPYQEFLDTQYNSSLFAAFRELSLKLLKGHELMIAESLAIKTPEKDRYLVFVDLNKAFGGTNFAKLVSTAFAIRRDIHYFLLGDDPGEFFFNEEFNPECYLKFPNLFDCLLLNKERAIGFKLAKICYPDLFLVISIGLEKLESIPSLKRVAKIMYEEKERKLSTKTKIRCNYAHHAEHRNGLFENTTLTQRKHYSQEDIPLDSGSIGAEDGLMNLELKDDDEEDETNICQKYCTLF